MESNIKIHQVLPQDFKPVNSLVLCSNSLQDFKYIINDNNFIPILIGVGNIPRIWIYAKSNNTSISVIRDNISNLPNIKINIYLKESRLSIEYISGNNINNSILKMDFKESKFVVTEMDLRPIGYNIYGNEQGLTIGTSKMNNNKFQGIESFIKTGNKI